MNRSASKYLLICCMTIIVLLGAYLRLHRIHEYLTFLGDEGRDVLIVKRMIVDGDMVFLGPTASVGGFFLGPLYYYFMSPFLWLWNLDPAGPAVMVALFGVATIYLVFHVGSKMFHPIVGLVGASLYAVSPLVIAYSRSSWNPNLVPFFSLLLVYLLWKYAIHKTMILAFFIGIVSGMGIQFHYLYSILIAFSLLILVFFSRKAVLKHGVVWFFGLFLMLSPFVAFEFRHSFPNTRALINFFLKGNETAFVPARFIEIVHDVAFRSYGRLLFRMPQYEVWNGYPDWHIALLVVLIRTTLYISIGVVVYMSIRFFRKSSQIMLTREQGIGAALLSGWFLWSISLFGFYQRSIYDYYFGIFFAFPFIALGIVLWQLMKTKKGIAIGLFVWGGLFYYNWQGRPFMYPPNNQLEQTKRIAKAALDMTEGKPFNFALITATNSDHAYRYFFEIWGRSPIAIEQPSVDPERKTVTDQLIVICENPSCQPLGHSSWEVAGFGRAEIVEEKDVFPVKLFKLIHYKGEE